MALDLNLKSRRDWNNTIAYAVEQAVAGAVAEKDATISETVRNMRSKGFSIETIQEITGLGAETIKRYLL